MPRNIVARQRILHTGHVAGGHAAHVLVLAAEALPGRRIIVEHRYVRSRFAASRFRTPPWPKVHLK